MTGRKKEAGNVGEILTIGLCILALTALMISYMENVQLIAKSGSAGTMLSAQDGNGRLSGGSGSDAVDRRTGESGDDRD